MQTVNRPQEIFNFFSKNRRMKLRDAFIEHFEISYSSYYSKLRDGNFVGEELLFFERWAAINGMPPKDETQFNQNPAA